MPRSKTDFEEAIEILEDIFYLCENIPDVGEDFAESVLVTAKDIKKSIVVNDRVTPGQFRALENIQRGLKKWFHDEDED